MSHSKVVAHGEPVRPKVDDVLVPNVASGSGDDERGDVEREAREHAEGESEAEREAKRARREEADIEEARGRRESKGESVEEVQGEQAGADGAVRETSERAVGEKIRRVPKGPSEEEYRIHRATHCPFRSWCPKCIAGRAKRGPHTESDEQVDDTPPGVCGLLFY